MHALGAYLSDSSLQPRNMVKIVPRIANSEQLLIKKIAAETNRLIAEEKAQIIALSQGVPNLPIFEPAQARIAALLDSKKLPYTDVAGTLPTRDVCAQFVNRFYAPDKQFAFDRNNIIVTAGAIQAVYDVIALSIDSKANNVALPQIVTTSLHVQDDVVVSPLPAYGLYKHQTELLGGEFYAIPTAPRNNFVPTLADLQATFDRYTVNGRLRIRCLVLCFPNNPTGRINRSWQRFGHRASAAQARR